VFSRWARSKVSAADIRVLGAVARRPRLERRWRDVRVEVRATRRALPHLDLFDAKREEEEREEEEESEEAAFAADEAAAPLAGGGGGPVAVLPRDVGLSIPRLALGPRATPNCGALVLLSRDAAASPAPPTPAAAVAGRGSASFPIPGGRRPWVLNLKGEEEEGERGDSVADAAGRHEEDGRASLVGGGSGGVAVEEAGGEGACGGRSSFGTNMGGSVGESGPENARPAA
jgi:hypothetical protein